MKKSANIWKRDDGDIRIHYLKTWSIFYNALVEQDITKRKTLEIRRFDRDFQVGDFLLLQDFNPVNQELGKATYRLITHMLHEQPWVPEGYVALSIIERAPSIRF